MLALAAKGLGSLKDEAAFVGGSVIELYLAGQPALKVRATDDVDCVVEAVSRTGYHKLEEKLRARGFRHPLGEPGPICRWEYQGLIVDVMPLEGSVLGFSNRWYPEGSSHAATARLPDGSTARRSGYSPCRTSSPPRSRRSRAAAAATSWGAPTWRTS